jgi:hypothetical protein
MTHRPVSHPLDKLISNQSLFLIEAIIPFVDKPMKKPLVMYLKFSELQEIIRALNDEAYINDCDFCRDFSNQEDVITALNQCGYGDIAGQMSQLKSAINMMNIMNMMSPNDEGDTAPYNFQNDEDSTENTLDNIMDILNEYDKENGNF